MDTTNDSRVRQWCRGLRPLLWWGLLVLVLYGYRLHERWSEQTRLSFSIVMQNRPVDYMASVTLDGRYFRSGQRIGLGHHEFTVSHPNADIVSTNLFIWYGLHDLGQIVLKRHVGILAVQSTPKARQLSIRGAEYSQILTNSSGVGGSIPTGRYVIEAWYAHWRESKTIEVAKNNLTECRFTPPLGAVSMTCNQTNVSFRLLTTEGQEWEDGMLPATIEGLPQGKYKAIASRREDQREVDITVQAGITNAVNIEFLYGIAVVETEPPGATVFKQDGRNLGATPLRLAEVKPGQLNLELRQDGYEPLQVSLTVVANETATLKTNLLSTAYVRSMAAAKRYLQEKDFDRALKAVGEAVRAKVDDREAIAFEKVIQEQKAAQEEKERKEEEQREAIARRERFERFVVAAGNAISRKDVDNAQRAIKEARYLFPDDPKIAELESGLAPLLRDKMWQAALKTLIPASPYCSSGVSRYGVDLAAANAGADKAIAEALSFWKLNDEKVVNEKTIIMRLAPRGLDHQRACILMLSEVGKEKVEIRYQICLYTTSDGRRGQLMLGPLAITSGTQVDAATLQRDLDGAVKDLLGSLKRHLVESGE